jgi:RNA polymerase sigma-70 factor (ECF subfamily)
VNSTTTGSEPASDEELLLALQGGRRDVFGTLIRRYERELYSYLWRYLGDAELAADVFQNTCVAIFRKIRHYDTSRSAKPWIYTIATNQAIDASRQRARRRDQVLSQDHTDDGSPSFFEAIPQAGPGPNDQVVLTEQQQRIREALTDLNESQRQVIVLTYFQGLKYQEAAEVLGVPLGTVKSRLNAAMTRLTEVWMIRNPEVDEAGRPT